MKLYGDTTCMGSGDTMGTQYWPACRWGHYMYEDVWGPSLGLRGLAGGGDRCPVVEDNHVAISHMGRCDLGRGHGVRFDVTTDMHTWCGRMYCVRLWLCSLQLAGLTVIEA